MTGKAEDFLDSAENFLDAPNAQPSAKADDFLDSRSDVTGTPDGNDVGRLGTAVGQFIRGAAGGISSVPKGIAIMQAGDKNIADTVLSAMDRIDAGESVHPNESLDIQRIWSSHLAPYQNASPEQRAGMRGQFTTIRSESIPDPRQNPKYQLGERIDKAAANIKNVNPKYKEEFWAGKVPQGVGSTFSFLLGAPAGPAGIAAMGALSGSAEMFEDATNKGASLDDALKASGWGALVGTSEAVPISHALSRLDNMTGGSVKKTIISMFKQGTEEAIQEGFQQISQNLIASDVVGYDPERAWYQGAGENAGVGFTAGALMDFLFTVVAGGGRRTHAPKADGRQASEQTIPVNAEDFLDGGARSDRGRAPEQPPAALGLPSPDTVSKPIIEVTPEGGAGTRDQIDAARREQERRAADLGMNEVAGAVQGRAPLPELTPQLGPQTAGPDDLLKTITRAGGLNRDEAKAQGIDPEHFKDRSGVFGKNLFPRQGGMTMDALAEFLSQSGYLPEGQYYANDALDLVSRALGGEKIYSQQNAARAYDRMDMERQRDLADQKQDRYQPAATPEELARNTEDFRRAIEGVKREQIRRTFGDEAAKSFSWMPTKDDLGLSGHSKESAETKSLADAMFNGRQIMGDDAFEAFFERFSAQHAELDSNAFERRLNDAIRSQIDAQAPHQPGHAEANREGAGDQQEDVQARQRPEQPQAGTAQAQATGQPEPRQQPAKEVAPPQPPVETQPAAPAPAAAPEQTPKTEPARHGFGDDNKVFTREGADSAREILRRKLRSQLNSGLDPEMMQAGIQLAGYYIEGGARSFKDYSAKMVSDLGEAIRPYLKAFYTTVRNWPGFDTKGMNTDAEIDATQEDKKPETKKREPDTNQLPASTESVDKTPAKAGVSASAPEKTKAKPEPSTQADMFAPMVEAAKAMTEAANALKESVKPKEEKSAEPSTSEKPGLRKNDVWRGNRYDEIADIQNVIMNLDNELYSYYTPSEVAKIHRDAPKSFEAQPEYLRGKLKEAIDAKKLRETSAPPPRDENETPAMSLDRGTGRKAIKNAVIRQVRDSNANVLGTIIEQYDGTKEGAVAAAKRATDKMWRDYPDASNIQSRIGATDENGNPKWAISPNYAKVEPADSREGQAVFGDDDAIHELYGQKSLVDEAAHEAATSPQNALPQPTEAQKEAGNYAKGHITINGLDIAIENPEGSKRRPEWPTMQSHYGYIKGTIGKDKDHLDVFVKPGTPDDYSGPVFVVDQTNKEGAFDEHKIMLGWPDEQSARAGYLENYTKGWNGLGAIKQYTMPEFKLWLKAGNTKKPVLLGKTESGTEPAAPKSSPKETLLKAGLNVRQAKTNNGNDVWEVTGSGTRQHKDMLKSLGGRWYGPKKAWSFYKGDPSEQIAKNLDPTYAVRIQHMTEAGAPIADWWNKELTNEGRKQAATAAGSPSGISSISWRHLPRHHQAAMESLRDHGWAPDGNPEPEEASLVTGIGGVVLSVGDRVQVRDANTQTVGPAKTISRFLRNAEGRDVVYFDEGGQELSFRLQPAESSATKNTKKEPFTFTIKPQGDGFILKSDDGGGFVATRETGRRPMFAGGARARIFKTEKEAELYAKNKGMALADSRPVMDVETAPNRADTVSEETANEPTQRTARPETGDRGGDRAARTDRTEDSGQMGFGLEEGNAGDGEGRNTPRTPERSEQPGGDNNNRGESGRGHESSGGSRDRGSVRAESRTVARAHDFTITDADEIGDGSVKTKYQNNIAAIRLLKSLEEEGRRASADEQATLAKYVGWGGIKGAFDPNNKQWAKEHAELKELLTDEEYEAARRSILDAHYTSVPIIKNIWTALGRMGFRGGRVLEPSVGVGNFFGLMPADVRAKSSMYGVELDKITAGIARQLYQTADIAGPVGFQDVNIPADSYDVAVGNPPFGSQSIYDKNHPELKKFSLHNFFFAKALDKVRPGGLMTMVVSRYFMDAADPSARQHIADRAKLVAAFRLPYTAFKGNANTEVVTDIIVLQKLGDGITPYNEWVKTTEIDVDGNKKRINQYFADNPNDVIGRFATTGSMYSKDELTVEPVGDFEKSLAERVKLLPENIYSPETHAQPTTAAEVAEGVAPKTTKIGAYFITPDGKLAMREPDSHKTDANGELLTTHRVIDDMPKATEERVRGLVKVREALRDLIRAELSQKDDTGLKQMRLRLNSTYDAFVKKYGYINALGNRRAFQDDPDMPLLESLEPEYDPGVSATVAKSKGLAVRQPKADKAAIFTKRVLAPYTKVEKVDNATDALTASLNEKGGVDLDHMSEISGLDEDALVRELSGLIYQNPENRLWEIADTYLSGNVKAKLKTAQKAAEADPARYAANVAALEKVQPADLTASDISAQMGAGWIPTDVISAFGRELLGMEPNVHYIGAVGRWSFKAKGEGAAHTATWGTARVPAGEIIDHLLNAKAIVVKDNHGTSREPKWVVNDTETQAARAKADDVSQKFKDWIWQDPKRRERLEKIYNDTMNTDRLVSRDGSHLTLPGSSPTIKLRPHQLAAIWRVIQDRTALLDHVVGAGKTFEMTAAAMELRRLGLARKPLFVVPNHLVRQWRDEFYRLYPNANILATTEKDFQKANRQKLFSRITTGDWDAVIVAHSSFKKIGMPPDTEAEILNEMLKDISDAIEDMKSERGDRNIMRDMERIKENLEAKMDRLKETGGKKDNVVTFDELGADALFLDEAHLFKNLFYHSQMQGVTGLGNPAGSGRAFDMFVKTRFLQKHYGGRAPVVFATGTPVSNSLVEMFTMQRYMMYDDLRDRGIHLLDPWAKMFGEVQNVYEVHPSGNGYRLATRFAKFQNIGELMKLYRGFADVITMDDLKAQSAAAGKRFPVPKLKDGKPALVVAERSEQQTQFFGVPVFGRSDDGSIQFKHDDLSVVANKDGKYEVRNKHKSQVAGPFDSETEAQEEATRLMREPVVKYNEGSILWKFENLRELTRKSDGKVNALSITNEARKAGLDFRLIDSNAPDFAGSKINLAVKNILGVYKEWSADKGTQLVFCDLSVPSSARDKILKEAAKQAEKAAAESLENEAEDTDSKDTEEAPAEEEEAKISMDQLLATKSKHSVYDDVKAKLIKSGIPENEVAFIHDYDTADKKQKLFQAVRDGRIRVLIGSTEKMGAGMNVQDRLVAIHHLDAPWRPSDLEQRNGRIIRQGNKLYERDPDGFEVQEFRYASKQTYDTRMWQIIEHKARGIEQLRKADESTRTMDDIAGEAASAADMKAAASGNPLILDEIKLRTEIRNLEAQESNHNRSKFDMQRKVAFLEKSDERYTQRRADIGKWMDIRSKHPSDADFSVKIGDKTFKERKDIGGAMVSKLGDAAKDMSGKIIKAGLYRGVQFGFRSSVVTDDVQALVSSDGEHWGHLTVYGRKDEFSPSGLLTRIDNMLKGLDVEIDNASKVYTREKDELVKAREEASKPFAKKAMLEEARRKHRDIVAKLQKSGGAISLTPEMRLQLDQAIKKRGLPPLDEAKFSRKNDVKSMGNDGELSPGDDLSKLNPDDLLRLFDGAEQIDAIPRRMSEDELQDAEARFLSNAPAGARYPHGTKLLARRLRPASDEATNELGGSFDKDREVKGPLGPFSKYSTSAEVNEATGDLQVYVYAYEQVDAGITQEPALMFTVTKDGELTVNGPHPGLDTFKEFHKRGWADYAKDADGKTLENWSAIKNPNSKDRQIPFSQVIPLLADVHARVRLWRDQDRVGLYWARSTGAMGGLESITDRNGTAVFFSRQEGRQQGGLSASGLALRDLEATVARVTKGYNNLPQLVVLENPEQAAGTEGKSLREQIERAGAMHDVEGAFHDGKIYLFADNLRSEERAEHVLMEHELSHYGLRGVFGKDLDPILSHIYLTNAKVRAQANERRAALGLKSNVAAVEEVLADMPSKDLPKLKGWDRLISFLRDWLARHGFQKLADRLNAALVKKHGEQGAADLFAAEVITKAREWARSGKQTQATQLYMGVTKLSDDPKFSRNTTSATEAAAREERDNLPTGVLAAYKDRARKIIDRIDKALDPLGSLPDNKEYLAKRYTALGRIAKVDEIAGGIGKAFHAASPEDRVAVYDYLTTRDAKPDGIKNELVRSEAKRVKALINSVGDALEARGLLDPETREANRDAYLPRLYLKHLLSNNDWKALGSGKKPSDMGYLKQRKDIPEDVRRVILGEITDPGFLAATAIAKPARDMALLDFLTQVSKNEKWVHPSSIETEDGETVTPHFLKAEADRLRRQADHYAPEDAKTARALADRLETKANKALANLNLSADDLKQYRQIPDTKRHGRLRGLWVRKEIYDDLVGVYDMNPTDPGFLQSLLGYGGVGTKVTQIWKMGKVALNPPAQVRNFVSNGVLLQLSGVPFHKVPVYLTRAVRAIHDNGDAWKVAKKYGVTESTFSTQELYRIKRDLLDLEMREGNLKTLGKLHRAGAIVADKASDAYQFSEALFKTAKIMHAMDSGMSEAEAAIEAQKWMFDYSLVPKNVRYARNAPVGMPFLTFQYKVLPRLAEVALLHPQRLIPWIGLFAGWPLLWAAMTGDDDDEYKRLQKSMPEWLQNRGHAMILPWRDDEGRWQVADLGYFMPWSMYTDLLGDLKRGELGEAAQTVGLFSGPVTNVIVTVKTGKDPFTGRDVVNPGDPLGRQIVSGLNYIYDMMMPPIVTSRGLISPMGIADKEYGGKAVQAVTGRTNKMGDPSATGTQAALYPFGINIYSVEPQHSMAQNVTRLKYELDQTELALKRKLQNRGLSDDDKKEIVQEYKDEMRRRQDKINEYLNRE